jgi:hypothetical protein
VIYGGAGADTFAFTSALAADTVDSELTCPVLVAPQMSASSASVLLWDCGQRVCVVHISTGRAAERI